jgi:predicted amidophosphoribosyltransferase
MIGAVTVASACVLSASVAGGYVWAKLSATGVYSHRACPKCRQRLRFLANKAGRPGQCPRCGNRFTLTAAEAD